MSKDPHSDLRDYLSKIDAPSDSMEHITKVLGWRPPPIWEAPRAEAEAINATVQTPDGMRHIGWFCEHPMEFAAALRTPCRSTASAPIRTSAGGRNERTSESRCPSATTTWISAVLSEFQSISVMPLSPSRRRRD